MYLIDPRAENDTNVAHSSAHVQHLAHLNGSEMACRPPDRSRRVFLVDLVISGFIKLGIIPTDPSETSGDMLFAADIVVKRRDGPRRLHEVK